MSEIEAPWLVQVSLKTTGQTLINVRGMEVGDVAERLDGIIEIADKIAEAETAVGVVQMVKKAMGPGTATVPPLPPTPPPAGAPPAAPTAPAPVCSHGLPAKFIAGGISKKNNRPYGAFWACSQDQAYQCDFRQQA